MVKRSFFITLSTCFLSLIIPIYLLAAEFTASVSSKQVGLNEGFSLNLTLKGTSPKEAPSIFKLKEHFSIYSEQRSTNTTILNGKVSSSITWKLSLMPKEEGLLSIPSVTIDTEEGILSTEPITLKVVSDPADAGSSDSAHPSIHIKVSNPSPYKNEPFIYTALLVSKKPFCNIQTEKMQLQDAIVDLLEEPKLEERSIEGVLCQVVEFAYLITPLKAGPLKIPSLTIQGAIPQKGKDPFSSLFNSDMHPLMMMQGFERLKPFSLASEEVELDVQMPIAEISPWLPTKELTLEEQWPSDQILRVGEPFSRGFLIQAEGLKASQLPSLESLQGQSPTLKIYSDKPEDREKVYQGAFYSSRKEAYTFIPQKAGACVLPEISITWWDISKKEKKSSTIPARTLEVLPSLESVNETTASFIKKEKSETITESDQQVPASSNGPSFLLYTIVGVLFFFLIAALIWVFILQKKITSLNKGPSQKPLKEAIVKPPKPASIKAVKKDKKERLDDLNPT